MMKWSPVNTRNTTLVPTICTVPPIALATPVIVSVCPLSFAGPPALPGVGEPTPAPVEAGTVTVEGLTSGRVVAGGELTVTGSGFGPGETGIRLELRSDPVVLAANLTADASGVVTATVTVPAGTPAGRHTLVLVGAGRTLTQEITVTAAPARCVARAVTGATLTWGVRDSFRT